MPSKRKQGTHTPKGLTLLIITDEFGSASSRDRATIQRNTSRHFARFIELLIHPAFPGAILIKNVGDSLMIRVQINRSRQSILNLLQAILDAQKELASYKVHIRALVALLSDSKYELVEGSSISSHLNRTLKKSGIQKKDWERLPRMLPSKSVKEWLKDDLFGTPVARAFRSSTIPKECDLVVESSVAELAANNNLSSAGGIVGNIKFGPNVAFSPIRGMHDLYDIGRPQLKITGDLDSSGNMAHVWLRTVKLVDKTSPRRIVEAQGEDSLIRRQQQTRVLTEFVLPRANSSTEQAIQFWHRALSVIENNAEYFRFIGHPLCASTWINRDGEISRENTYHAQLLILGAYPEFDTYFNIRESIHKLNEQCANKADKVMQYAQTTMLWSPRAPEQTAPTYWRRLEPRDIFIVVMGRAQDKDRTDNLTIAGTSWQRILGNIEFYPNKLFTDIGAVMGEWDYYGIYDLASSDSPTEDKLRDIEEKCIKQIAPHVARLRLYVCQVPEINNA